MPALFHEELAGDGGEGDTNRNFENNTPKPVTLDIAAATHSCHMDKRITPKRTQFTTSTVVIGLVLLDSYHDSHCPSKFRANSSDIAFERIGSCTKLYLCMYFTDPDPHNQLDVHQIIRIANATSMIIYESLLKRMTSYCKYFFEIKFSLSAPNYKQQPNKTSSLHICNSGKISGSHRQPYVTIVMEETLAGVEIRLLI